MNTNSYQVLSRSCFLIKNCNSNRFVASTIYSKRNGRSSRRKLVSHYSCHSRCLLALDFLEMYNIVRRYLCIGFLCTICFEWWIPNIVAFPLSQFVRINDPSSTSFSRNRIRAASLRMAFDTFVKVESNFESKVGIESHDPGCTLTDYMRLPVEQYVCIQMPLNASLERMSNNQFNMTVPPVRFFNLDVSPMLICDVVQTATSVKITSNTCVLRGSPYVVGLNGCFKINVSTKFTWADTAEKKSIISSSQIFVEVDPPRPFKYFGKTILESTGTLAMSIALRQIENAFVQSLARDYTRWATDSNYRRSRAANSDPNNHNHDFSQISTSITSEVSSDFDGLTRLEKPQDSDFQTEILLDITNSVDVVKKGGDDQDVFPPRKVRSTEINMPFLTASNSISTTIEDNASNNNRINTTNNKSVEKIEEKVVASPLGSFTPLSSIPALSSLSTSPRSNDPNQPLLYLTDDICLLPGSEPEVRIESAPSNARRIYTGVDILADIEEVWKVLTDYENLQTIVPSLLQNKVLQRYANGGARLSQVGGAKVLPGITFKARTILDVQLYREDSPMPEEMFASLVDSDKCALQRDIFPRPYALTTQPHRDITMQNVAGEGDFEHYQGVWRVQSLPGCRYDDDSFSATRLTYAVEIQPRGFLPVNLIEGRIANDLKTNLDAIRCHVEKLQKRHKKNIANAAIAATATANGERSLIAASQATASDSVVNVTKLQAENAQLKQRVAKLEKELLALSEVLGRVKDLIEPSSV